jgi:hypothetical protein
VDTRAHHERVKRALPAALLAIAATVACAMPAAAPAESPSPTPVAVATSSPTPTPSPTPVPTATPSPTPRPLPVAAEEPGALAEQIRIAELAIRDASVTGEELAWMGHLQQLAYRRLVERPEWSGAVIAALPGHLRGAATANYEAGAELRALTAPREELPAWRIIEPAPADDLMRYYREAEVEFGVPWSYLAAIHLSETRMGRIRGTSIAGAQGPMQFMPGTWAAFGEGDINSDRDAIRAAARYLRHNGAPGNMANALFRYNNSQRYVRAVTAYAEVMRADTVTFRGYYHWQVYYRTTRGDVLLPVGYRRDP